jgi:SET domain-containing protein
MPVKKNVAANSVRLRNTVKGKGVFALKRFRKSQRVGEVSGTIIEGIDYDSRYCIELSDTHVLEPTGIFRFLNHSCEPNCELFSWKPDDLGDESHRVFVEALRKIEPGDELTIDYAWNAEAAIPCLCGAESCRGWIVDPDEINQIKRRKRA